MIGEIHRLRDKSGETEKITINIGFVDLGHIDLLVHEGLYSNRSDFIRTAIRNQLAITRMLSSNRSCDTPSNSAYDGIAAKIWKRRRKLAASCASRSSGLR
jgi:Arc/MetJ-type ribon-helix-helix transcriptional regulator